LKAGEKGYFFPGPRPPVLRKGLASASNARAWGYKKLEDCRGEEEWEDTRVFWEKRNATPSLQTVAPERIKGLGGDLL